MLHFITAPVRVAALREYYGQWEVTLLIFNWHFPLSLRRSYDLQSSSDEMFSCSILFKVQRCLLFSPELPVQTKGRKSFEKRTQRFSRFLNFVSNISDESNVAIEIQTCVSMFVSTYFYTWLCDNVYFDLLRFFSLSQSFSGLYYVFCERIQCPWLIISNSRQRVQPSF